MNIDELKDFFGDKLTPYHGELNENHDGLSYIGGHLSHINEIKEKEANGYYLGKRGTALPLYALKEGTNIGLGCSYAHAADSLLAKQTAGIDEEEFIAGFVATHDKDGLYTIEHFWHWHRLLTKSCYGGGEKFKKEHNLKDNDLITVLQFIKLTENDYGNKIIKKLKPYYE